MGQRLWRARQHIRTMRFQPLEKVRVAEQSVFDDFGITGTQFAVGQCVQKGRIRQNEAWLMKGANQIFASRCVDACLTTNRTVHLSEKRAWHLNEVDPAQQAGCGKTDQIAHHTAAQCDEHDTTINTERQNIFKQV